MLKKMLLTTMTFVSFNSIQANSTLQPHPHPAQNAQHPHAPLGQKNDDLDCKEKAWIITDETGKKSLVFPNGKEIDLHQEGQAQDHPSPTTHHEDTSPHHLTEDEKNLKRNPLLTPDQEALREELQKEGIGSYYDRNGKKEFGKEYNGVKYPHGVYFPSETGTKDYRPGLWVLDKTIQPKGLSNKQRPTVKMPKRAQPQDSAVKHPELVPPSAVGLTVRTNTAHMNPQTKKVELSQGAANVAQTGLTGEQPPHIDASGDVPPPPPPPPAQR